MHPHGADRHTLDVAQPGADARVEDAGQAEVGPEAERELNVIRGVPGEQEHRRLHVGDDAHRRALRIDATAERKPGGDHHHRRPAHQVAPDAQQQGAVEREVDRVRDHALPFLGPDQELGCGRFRRIETAPLVPEGGADVPHSLNNVARPRMGGRATVSDPVTRLTPPRVEPQKRTPPVMMNVLPPPISPRASTNGMSLLPFNLNVVPPSRFSPALVSEALTVVVPTVAEALAWATFKPPPA